MPKKNRTLVTSLDRLARKAFGPLVTRALPDGGLLGDVSVIHESLPARTRLPAVTHLRTAELVYCVSGEMTAVLGTRKLRLKKGSVALIPPGVAHRFVTAGKSCEALSIFSPALVLGPKADVVAEP